MANKLVSRCPACNQPLDSAAREFLRKSQKDLEERLAEDLSIAIRKEERAKAAKELKHREHELAVAKEQLALVQKKNNKAMQAARDEERAKLEKKHAHDVDVLNKKMEQLAEKKAAVLAKDQTTAAVVDLQKKLETKSKQLAKAEKEAADHKRRLEDISPHARGALAEAGLLQVLRSSCPADQFDPNRSDVLQTICEDRTGTVIAKVLYESKDTLGWDSKWINKAKKDARRQEATHSVIVTRVMPRGAQAYVVLEGVYVVDVSAIQVWSRLFRELLCTEFQTRSAHHNLEDRLSRVYRFMISKEFAQHFEAISSAAKYLDDQMRKERDTHEKQWDQRRESLEKIWGAHRAIDVSVVKLLNEPLEAAKSDGRRALSN